ncbi:MAG: hypothetical protein WBB60_11525, partial [Nitrospira sp.]
MGGRPRCERHDLLWFAAAILSLCATTPAAAAGTATARHQQPEASSMTVHVPIPMTTLAEPYASIHQT